MELYENRKLNISMKSDSNFALGGKNVIILPADKHCEKIYYHEKNFTDSTLSSSSLH